MVGKQADNADIERRVRAIIGRSDAVVTAVRRRVDAQGNAAGYEVDIR
jgi:hypothetical protein